MTTPIWTTKDGRRVPVTEMTDEHLANAIAMLERKTKWWRDVALGAASYRGEAAQDAAAEALCRASVQESSARSWIRVLRGEMGRRGMIRTAADLAQDWIRDAIHGAMEKPK